VSTLSTTLKTPVSQQNNTEKWLPIVFLIWPLLAFFLAWRIFPRGNSKTIINAFYVLYGFLFVVNPLMDSQRYSTFLQEAHALPFDNFYTILTQLYESSLDVLLPFLTYIVSRFTDDHGFLFATFAFIFGLVSLGQLSYFFQIYKKNPSTNGLVFLLLLPWIIPIFEINGFRFWMATWVYVFGIIHYLQTRDFKYIVVVALSLFVHFAFVGPILIFLLWLILGNRPALYLFGAVITLFVSELNFEAVKSYLAFLGPAIENKATIYTHDEYVENITAQATQSSWFIKLNSNLLFYFFIFKLFVLFIQRKKIKEHKFAYKLFTFSLLFLSFVNVSSLFPSGGRFLTPFLFFACGITLIFHSSVELKYRLSFLNKAFILPILLFIIVTLRVGMDSINAALLLPGFLIPFGAHLEIPLLDFF
jgi:hypothetical protein